MNLIILGPQGSGKGTQAKLLAQKFDLEHIEMGKFLREVAKFGTSLGKEIHEIINVRKELVGDQILKKVLRIKLADLPREKGVAFDGVPRRRDQLEYFEEALQEFGRKVDAVIYISLSEEESINRISKRWNCKKCAAMLIMGVDIQSEKDKCPKCGGEIFQRIDDTPEGVKKRLKIFREETMPVIDDYRKRKLLIEVDGRPSIEEIARSIEGEIKKRGL